MKRKDSFCIEILFDQGQAATASNLSEYTVKEVIHFCFLEVLATFIQFSLGVLTTIMKTKTSTVLTNQSALLVSRNAGKNPKNNSENNGVRN